MKVIVTCLTCNKNFETTSKRVELGKGKYCSRACLYSAKRAPMKQIERYKI